MTELKLVVLAAFTMMLVEQPACDGPKPYNDIVLKCLCLPYYEGITFICFDSRPHRRCQSSYYQVNTLLLIVVLCDFANSLASVSCPYIIRHCRTLFTH